MLAIDRRADPRRSDRRSHGAADVLAIGSLTALAFALYWPLVVHFRTRFWAAKGDGAAFVWSYWSIPRAVLSFHNPFVTRGIFYPVGAHTAFDTNVPLWSMVAWPLTRLVGLSGASVIIGLIAVVGSGAGAYLLARALSCSRASSVFAGAAFEFLPYRTNRLVAHLNLIHTEVLAFGLLALIRLYQKPSPRRAVLLGAVAGLTVLTDFTYAIFLALACLVLALCRFRSTIRRPLPARLLLAGGIAVLVSLPVLVPATSDVIHGEYPKVPGLGGAQAYSADVVSWVVPYDRQPLWGKAFSSENARVTGGERVEFTGYVVLALAIFGLAFADRRKWEWVAIATVFGLLSFGPFLHVNGKTGSGFTYEGLRFAIPLPYLLLVHLPGISGLRAPARFGVVASLALIILAAFGIDQLVARRPRWLASVPAVAIPVTATIIVLVEFLPPGTYPTLPVAVPAVYHRIASDPDPGAVLDIPLQFRTGFAATGDQDPFDTRYMYNATTHHRAMAGGMVARLPANRLAALEAIPVYAQILAAEGSGATGAPVPPLSFTASDLKTLGIRFVIYHLDHPEPTLGAYLDGLRLELYAKTPTLTVWKVA